MVSQWNSMPRGVVESPPLEMFKKHMDVAFGNMVWCGGAYLLEGGGTTSFVFLF